MADYSKAYFTFNCEGPALLPERLRLPNGFTRYSYDITLEEIYSCGYAGPVENSECQAELTSCPEDNEEAKSLLMSKILNSEDSFDTEDLMTESYKEKYGLYKAKLLDLYFKSDLSQLSCSDIPSAPQIHNGFKADEEAERRELASGLMPQYKMEYESYGVIPDLDSRLVDWLPLPGPDWVRGSGLILDPGTHNVVNFGRNCFS